MFYCDGEWLLSSTVMGMAAVFYCDGEWLPCSTVMGKASFNHHYHHSADHVDGIFYLVTTCSTPYCHISV